MRRAELEALLEGIPRHPRPDPDREQYRTPAGVAADLLWAAHEEGAVAGRRVLDLGCGTGVFAIGAARLGAVVVGVEVDAVSLALARSAAAAAGVEQQVEWVEADLADWRPEPGGFDTVLMNPPFGAQKGNRHGDRLFLQRAAEAVRPAGTAWFLAQEHTERFLAAFAAELGGRLERVASWDYPLQATMEHHRASVRTVRVGGYRFQPSS